MKNFHAVDATMMDMSATFYVAYLSTASTMVST